MDGTSTARWRERWNGLPRPLRRVLALYAAVGVLLWPVPLLNVLHVETCAVLAALAFFAAGGSSLRLFRDGLSVGRVLRLQEAALGVFLVTHTVSVLWAPNKGYPLGLLFFLLFPVVTVVLAVGLAYALSAARVRRKGVALALIGLLTAVAGPVYDLGFHPQFYTYNHVFGGVLGPIYDEELAVRPGLFAFRGLTLLWALFFFLMGVWLRRGNLQASKRLSSKSNPGSACQPTTPKSPPGQEGTFFSGPPLMMAVAGTAVAIGLCYLFAGRLGINTTPGEIRRTLGAVHRTEHFDIYYDPGALSREEVGLAALEHEYHYTRLSERLDVRVEERIASYVFPDAETKAALTGARYTNVAPVWLSQPQVHVLQPAFAEVLPHELAHVFSRPFGLPLLRATFSVGLVEGLAVALEPPDGLPTPDEQVITAALMRAEPGEAPELAERLAARLSPAGFWTGRGAVSYTTMGSFVGYLLEAYGAERFKQVYARGDYERVYGKPVDTLAAEWERHLLGLPAVSSKTAPYVARRFSVPSLFEVDSPHYVPPHARLYRRGVRALARGDTTGALEALEASLRRAPENDLALIAWGRVKLARGAPGQVVRWLAPVAAKDSLWQAEMLAGDAFVALGRTRDARRHYARALAELPPWLREWEAVLLLRQAAARDGDAARAALFGEIPVEGSGAWEGRLPQGGAVRLLVGLRAGAEGRYEAASRLLREPVDVAGWSVADRVLVEAQRRAWRAGYLFRTGNGSGAVEEARGSAASWNEAGAFNEGARLEALAAKYAWAAQRGWPAAAK